MSEDVIPKRHPQEAIRRAVEFTKTLPREDDYTPTPEEQSEIDAFMAEKHRLQRIIAEAAR